MNPTITTRDEIAIAIGHNFFSLLHIHAYITSHAHLLSSATFAPFSASNNCMALHIRDTTINTDQKLRKSCEKRSKIWYEIVEKCGKNSHEAEHFHNFTYKFNMFFLVVFHGWEEIRLTFMLIIHFISFRCSVVGNIQIVIPETWGKLNKN